MNCDRLSICDRLDAALEKMRAQQMEVRAIYLSPSDLAKLDRFHTRAFGVKGCKIHSASFDGHIVRPGQRSRIYSTNGVEVAVPKRISFRVVAVARDQAA
jgi:hypothetical protein